MTAPEPPAAPEPTTGEFRIFGPPGTGKTTWLSRQVERAASTHGPEALIVGSLTKAAAAEAAARINTLHDSQVGTLHAFAFRALGHPELVQKHLDDWNATHPRPDRQLTAGSTTKPEHATPEDLGAKGDKPGDQLYEAYHRLRARLTPRELWPSAVQSFARDFDAWKAATGLLDFTDLLETALRDVSTAPGRPSIGLFDEAQDLAPLDLALVRKWGESMEYFVLIGDDDQAIYYFRGATADAFLNPSVPDTHKRVLKQSHRVPRVPQLAAMAWIDRVKEREPKTYLPRDEDGAVRHLPAATWRRPDALLRDIHAQLNAGRTVMVLATASFMLAPTKAALRELGVPYWNPYRKGGEWNPLHPSSGTSAATRLLAYLRPDHGTWRERSRMWTGDDLHAWLDLVQTKGLLTTGAKDAVKALAAGPWGRAEVEISRVLEWIDEAHLTAFFDALDAAAHAGNQDALLKWLEPRLLAAKREALRYPMTVARQRGARALTEDPRVILGTVHSVKGGQADVVYVLPDLSPAATREWIVPGAARDAITRTFYVAFTRARTELVLCGASGTSVDWTPALKAVNA